MNFIRQLLALSVFSFYLFGPKFAFAFDLNSAKPTKLVVADENALITRLFDFSITMAGIIFVILFLVGGVQYLTGAGNEEQTGKAKRLLVDAVVGLIIVLAAWATSTFILNGLTNGFVRTPANPISSSLSPIPTQSSGGVPNPGTSPSPGTSSSQPNGIPNPNPPGSTPSASPQITLLPTVTITPQVTYSTAPSSNQGFIELLDMTLNTNGQQITVVSLTNTSAGVITVRDLDPSHQYKIHAQIGNFDKEIVLSSIQANQQVTIAF